MSESNAVNHPPHYTAGKIECIDALESAAEAHHGDGFLAHCTLTAIKYLWRWPAKGGLEDLKKARWYIDRAIASVERNLAPAVIYPETKPAAAVKGKNVKARTRR